MLAKMQQKEREQKQSEETHVLALQNIMNSTERQIAEQVQCIGASMAAKERMRMATIEGQMEQYRAALAKYEKLNNNWKNKLNKPKEGSKRSCSKKTRSFKYWRIQFTITKENFRTSVNQSKFSYWQHKRRDYRNKKPRSQTNTRKRTGEGARAPSKPHYVLQTRKGDVSASPR